MELKEDKKPEVSKIPMNEIRLERGEYSVFKNKKFLGIKKTEQEARALWESK
jgi:hypothetical protein